MKENGPENSRSYRYVFVIVDNLSKFSWTILLKNNDAQTIKNSFESILICSKRRPILIESDREIMKTLTLNTSLEIHPWELFLQNSSIVLLKIFLKDQLLK